MAGYVFVADDFTGASDTLATLVRAGVRARLFLAPPAAADLAGIGAWGIATDARAQGCSDVAALGARLGAALAPHRPGWLHLKVCSTFDSSPETGNFALLARRLARETGIDDIAVIGGQPSLGRFAVFGTLFARGPDGRVHRIDRHPVMASHPVTPMAEADLARHLAALGLPGLAPVARGAAGGAFPRLYDALDDADVVAAGRDLAATGRRLLVIGPSSVAEAWLASRPAPAAPLPRSAPLPRARARGPVLAFAGSRSPQTAAQVAAADGYARLTLNPAEVMQGGAALGAAHDWLCTRLARGQDCLAILTADCSSAIVPAELARRAADFVARVMTAVPPGALVVAGGDTSGAIVSRLSPVWLDHAADLCPGVPVLSAHWPGRDLPLVLKGGQMGGPDLLARAAATLSGRAA